MYSTSVRTRVYGEITPGDLQYSFFINNGTDAVEGAIKLARLFTGRTNFISSLRGFQSLVWDLSGSADFLKLEINATVSGPDGLTDRLKLKR